MDILPKNIYSSLKRFLPVSLKRKFKKQKPIFINPNFPAKPGCEKGRTLLIIVSDSFNQKIMRASTLLTLGYAHGWSEACGPVKLIWQKNIIKEISKHNNPIIFTNIYNYINWGEKEIKFLKNYDSFSIVNVHPNKYEQFKKDNPLIGNGDPFFYGGHNEACNKLIETKPKFVCSFAGNTAWDLFKDWQADGLHFEFLKLAADQNYYFPDPAIKKYGHIKMTYVGGYWPEKAQAFEMYLRPFEDILHTYGYGNWPYKHYGGELDIAEERQLYSSAGLVPLVTSPAGWYMAEVTERYFKAPACKAFCIADQNTGLKDVFTEDEMLQAKNAEHFSELVNDYLKGKIDVNYWKNKAYEAVMNKHLYRHRALQIKNIFETKTELK